MMLVGSWSKICMRACPVFPVAPRMAYVGIWSCLINEEVVLSKRARGKVRHGLGDEWSVSAGYCK